MSVLKKILDSIGHVGTDVRSGVQKTANFLRARKGEKMPSPSAPAERVETRIKSVEESPK